MSRAADEARSDHRQIAQRLQELELHAVEVTAERDRVVAEDADRRLQAQIAYEKLSEESQQAHLALRSEFDRERAEFQEHAQQASLAMRAEFDRQRKEFEEQARQTLLALRAEFDRERAEFQEQARRASVASSASFDGKLAEFDRERIQLQSSLAAASDDLEKSSGRIRDLNSLRELVVSERDAAQRRALLLDSAVSNTEQSLEIVREKLDAAHGLVEDQHVAIIALQQQVEVAEADRISLRLQISRLESERIQNSDEVQRRRQAEFLLTERTRQLAEALDSARRDVPAPVVVRQLDVEESRQSDEVAAELAEAPEPLHTIPSEPPQPDVVVENGFTEHTLLSIDLEPEANIAERIRVAMRGAWKRLQPTRPEVP